MRLSPSVISGMYFCAMIVRAPFALEHLDDRAEVHAVGLDAEDAHAAHAVERLQDDVAVLAMEGAQARRVARDQRRRDELAETRRSRASRCGRGSPGRLVEDARALRSAVPAGRSSTRTPCRTAGPCASRTASNAASATRRLGGVPRRYHASRVAGQRQRAATSPRRRRPSARGLRWSMYDSVWPRPRGLGHHRVGRVLVDLELRERIGDEKDVHGVRADVARSVKRAVNARGIAPVRPRRQA